MTVIDQLDEWLAESEQVERAMLDSLHENCPPPLRNALGLDRLDIADGVAYCVASDPSILLNRVHGLGLNRPVTVTSLAAVETWFADRGIGNWFLHLFEDRLEQSVRSYLNGPRFEQRRAWMKFGTGKPTPREVDCSLEVVRIGPERAVHFAEIVCEAFGMRPSSAPLLAALAGDPRWQLFVSYDGEQPAGAGALFVEGGFGWLDWGATRVAFRRRGSQSAVMAARLARAAELGCKRVYTETGEAVEGDPQHSYGNIIRAGFCEMTARQNFAPATPAASAQ